MCLKNFACPKSKAECKASDVRYVQNMITSVGAPHGMHDPSKYPPPLKGEKHQTHPKGIFKYMNNEVSPASKCRQFN